MFDFSKIEIKLIPNNEAKQFIQNHVLNLHMH